MDSRTRPISEQPSEWEGYKKLVVVVLIISIDI
jgi:hypothetical protein